MNAPEPNGYCIYYKNKHFHVTLTNKVLELYFIFTLFLFLNNKVYESLSFSFNFIKFVITVSKMFWNTVEVMRLLSDGLTTMSVHISFLQSDNLILVPHQSQQAVLFAVA